MVKAWQYYLDHTMPEVLYCIGLYLATAWVYNRLNKECEQNRPDRSLIYPTMSHFFVICLLAFLSSPSASSECTLSLLLAKSDPQPNSN